MTKIKPIVIDIDILKDRELTVIELLKLYYILNEIDDELINRIDNIIDYQKLQDKLYIKIIDGEIYLREKSIELVESLIVDYSTAMTDKKIVKKSKRVILNEVDQRIDEFRDKWKGLKAGSMGSSKACKQKLIRWLEENPEYNFDDILRAADLYLSTEGRNTKYLQRADYFIFKKDGKEELSRLSAFVDDVPEVEDDWTTKLI